MHGSFDQSGETVKHIYRNRGLGFFILPVVVVIALVALAIVQPRASNWISEAAQAEFVGSMPMPTQLAQPAAPSKSTVGQTARRAD